MIKLILIATIIAWAHIGANYAQAQGYSEAAIIVDKDGNLIFVDDIANDITVNKAKKNA